MPTKGISDTSLLLLLSHELFTGAGGSHSPTTGPWVWASCVGSCIQPPGHRVGFCCKKPSQTDSKGERLPLSILLVPKEPNSHHCSKEDHFPQQQPLTSCTLVIHVQFSSASSPVSCQCPRSLWGGLTPGCVGAWNKKPPCCSICAIQWKTAFIRDTLIARLECKKL